MAPPAAVPESGEHGAVIGAAGACGPQGGLCGPASPLNCNTPPPCCSPEEAEAGRGLGHQEGRGGSRGQAEVRCDSQGDLQAGRAVCQGIPHAGRDAASWHAAWAALGGLGAPLAQQQGTVQRPGGQAGRHRRGVLARLTTARRRHEQTTGSLAALEAAAVNVLRAGCSGAMRQQAGSGSRGSLG